MANIIMEFTRTLTENYANEKRKIDIDFALIKINDVLVETALSPEFLCGNEYFEEKDQMPMATASPLGNWFDDGYDSLDNWCYFLEDVNYEDIVIKDMSQMIKLKKLFEGVNEKELYNLATGYPKGFVKLVKLLSVLWIH